MFLVAAVGRNRAAAGRNVASLKRQAEAGGGTWRLAGIAGMVRARLRAWRVFVAAESAGPTQGPLTVQVQAGTLTSPTQKFMRR